MSTKQYNPRRRIHKPSATKKNYLLRVNNCNPISPRHFRVARACTHILVKSCNQTPLSRLKLRALNSTCSTQARVAPSSSLKYMRRLRIPGGVTSRRSFYARTRGPRELYTTYVLAKLSLLLSTPVRAKIQFMEMLAVALVTSVHVPM